MKAKLGQMMMIGIQGTSLAADEKKFIIENNIGGVILFPRNYQDPKQLHELCSELHSLRKQQADKAPLFISIDQEGGRVQRFKKPPFTVWPPLKKAGDIDNTSVTFQWSLHLSEELRAFGINLNFAPDLDIYSNPKNTVIGDRAISSEVAMVERHASAWVRGAIKAGILSCAKHFPGHGNTLLDSHEDLPVEDRTLEQLKAFELVPFKKAFRSKVDFVMLAHIIFKNIDADHPVSLSHTFIHDILRKEMGFRGLIITDDLDMGALTKHYSVGDIAVKTAAAGAEILLYCNIPESPITAMESLQKACQDGSLPKAMIEQTHLRITIEKQQKLGSFTPLSFDETTAILEDPERKAFAQDVAQGIVPKLAANE